MQYINESEHKRLIAQELKSRSVSASLGHFTLLALAFIFRGKDFFNTNIVIFTALLMSAIICRLLLMSKKINLSTGKWQSLFSLVILANGLGWGGLIYLSLLQTIEIANSYAFYIFILAGVTSGALYSLGPSKRDFHLYLSSIFGFFILHILNYYGKNSLSQAEVIIITITFYIFLSIQRNIYKKEWLQLANSKAELTGIMNSLPGVISLVRDNNYIFVNKTLSALMKRQPEEIVGQPVHSFTAQTNIQKELIPFINSADNSYSGELEIETETGPRAFFVIFKKIDTFGHEIVVAAFDIQDLRSAEKEIHIQRLKLQESAKMAALGEMSAGLAHEINNHLAIITFKAQQLAFLDSEKNENLQKGLDQIIKTGQKISSIIRSLKRFAREDEMEPFAKTSIHQIMDDTLQFCAERFKNHGIRLNLKLNEDQIIECRPVLLSQVLLNVLNNAHDAVEPAIEKWIEIEIINENNQIKILVTDSGSGVPETVREKVMNPFFTTKPVGKGIGLGLSLSKGIVESHHGKLWFDFENPFTRVVIEIPKRQIANSENIPA
ncbi:MAG: ATP-binding protein [Bdellovibrio sp.]